MASKDNEATPSLDKVQVLAGPNSLHLEEDAKHVHDRVLKSSHDQLGPWATAKKFKKVRYVQTLDAQV